MKAKCKDCGEVNWLLEKTEKRSYYAIVNPKELRWLERVKYKEVSPYTLVNVMVQRILMQICNTLLRRNPLK